MTAPFADHFSRVARTYAQFRPSYPAELFDWIAAAAPGREMAWDCGCGPGQATVALAERFERVVGTDASAEQLALAPAHPRVTWKVALAESSGLPAHSVDAVTVAQALHWFDLPRFWSEVRRVARPGALVAAWSYGLHSFANPAVDRVVHHFHDDVVGPWWPDNRRHVDRGYANLAFPFARVTPPPIPMTSAWSLERELGFLRSWSATQRMTEATGQDPIPALETALRRVWPGGDVLVTWPLTILAGRVEG